MSVSVSTNSTTTTAAATTTTTTTMSTETSTPLQYSIDLVKELYNNFNKNTILNAEYIKLFNQIRMKNKFNPRKFSYQKMNYNNWINSLSKEEEGKKNEKDILCEKIKNLLNKCSKTNYESLKVKLVDYIKDDIDILNSTLVSIFEMAIIQSIYCPVYSKLCKYLFEKYGSQVKQLVLNKCKERFKNFKKKEEARDEEDEYDLFCKVMKNKKKFVGIFLLVSCFYQESMVETMVIEKYIGLLFTELNAKLDEETRDKYVECFKTLFINVSKKLKQNIEAEKMTRYIEQIKILSKDSRFTNREKFMFFDILDLV